MKYPNIEKERVKRNMSIDILTDLIGVCRTTYYNWQKRGGIPLWAIIELIDLFEVSADYLISYDKKLDKGECSMDRLTARDKGHAFFPRCFKEPCNGLGGQCDDCLFMTEVCNRLADYEDDAQIREQGCEFCNGAVRPGYAKYNLNDPVAPHINIKINDMHYFNIMCNYCPMCGRNLRKEQTE